MHRESFDLIHDPSRPKGEIPPELVRLGIQFSDGRHASSFGQLVSGSSTIAIGSSDQEDPPDPERDILMTPRRRRGVPGIRRRPTGYGRCARRAL